jgi:D-xylulose reductase
MMSELHIESRGWDAIDLVIEATGAEPCVQMGLHLVKPAGTFVQVGMGAPNLVIPMYLVAGKELGVFGSFR